MADKLQGNGHKTETPDVSHIRNVEVTHEKSDVSVRGVLMFVVALTIAGIAIHVGIWLLFRYFNAQEARAPKPGPMALSGEARLLCLLQRWQREFRVRHSVPETGRAGTVGKVPPSPNGKRVRPHLEPLATYGEAVAVPVQNLDPVLAPARKRKQVSG